MADYGADLGEETLIQVEILERMFDDPGLEELRERSPDHPAVERLDQLTGLGQQAGRLHWETRRHLARAVGSMLIDRSTWASQSGRGDYWALIDDDRARRHVEGMISNPDAFDDVIAELFVWGWLRTEGISADLIGEEGHPDLRLGFDSGERVFAEVKRIRLGTQPSRVRRVIAKANTQIKRATANGVGVVFISVARATESSGTDSAPPEDIQPYLDEAERQLASGLTRSVARVIVTWDDWLEPNPVSELGQAFLIRRRSHEIDHRAPRATLAVPRGTLSIGMTVVIAVRRRQHF